jgi:hypothetical protein
MRNPTKIRRAALVGALAAVTATAFAMTASEEAQLNASGTQGVIVAEKPSVYLEPNETIVEESAPVVSEEVVTVAERPTAQPPVTVETRRLTLDERIQGDVMDAIYNMPSISGKIGVESRDAVVTLTGYTTTGGQAWRAAREAGRISGVRYVNNEIRPRVGRI